MTSHVNVTYDPGSVRAEAEKTLNKEKAAKTPGDWKGVDTGAPKLPASQAFCDRLSAAARERGRPLTAEEITLIGEGKPLPPVAKVPTVQGVEARLGVLEASVRLLTEMLLERLSALEQKSVPPHMRQVEKRG